MRTKGTKDKRKKAGVQKLRPTRPPKKQRSRRELRMPTSQWLLSTAGATPVTLLFPPPPPPPLHSAAVFLFLQ